MAALGMPTRSLSRAGKIYVTTVVVGGGLAVAASVVELLVAPVDHKWFLLAALTIVSGSASVRLPSVPATLSVSETFVFTSVLLFGAPAGTLTVALDGLIISLWFNRRRREIHRVLFNVAAPAASIWIAAQLFFAISGIPPVYQKPASLTQFLPALVLFTVAFFLLNSWLITFAISLETGERPSTVWRTNFFWLSLNFFCGASVAALLASIPRLTMDLTYVMGAVLPLLLVLYVTYRTSMARVEDANHHLGQMNEMYLSTIEALAMAVDAKDQVTHGHVRRVQSYALALARALNVNDHGLIRAVEAASLLHDMGKLAVPEHILNKPGKLTKAEFERMKLHADIGADILSSIKFPYPVIPIVRHHHENWDGSGYPHGLRGIDIPIGARILAVVDCFDALTSDRPYRKKLSDDEAREILLERRGKMYDPLVVDTFLSIYSRVAAEQQQPPTEAQTALMELTKLIAGNKNAKPAADFFELDTELLREAFRVCHALDALALETANLDRYAEVARQLQVIAWYDCLVLWGYVRERDCLVAVFSSSPDVLYSECEIPLGDKLTGWVAANKASVLNASPALDVPYSEQANLSSHQSVLSVPLTLGDQLVGVLSVYSDKKGAYSIGQQRLLEVVAPHLALVMTHQTMAQSVPCPDQQVRTLKSPFVH